jgi:erythromycin esterase-like protein
MNKNKALLLILILFTFDSIVMQGQPEVLQSKAKEKSFQLRKSDVTPLSYTDPSSFDRIPELQTKKIGAIGERIHGRETMNDIAYQIIKQHVEKNRCRLVLLEISLEVMMSFNRFVQGDRSFNIYTLINRFNLDLISVKQLKEICLWLKEYNKTAKEKILLLGADYYVSSMTLLL